MRRLAWIVATALAGAVIVHVLLVLLLPRFAQRDAWAELDGLRPDGIFRVLADAPTEDTTLVALDPAMVVAVCRLVLPPAPVRVAVPVRADFWSAAVFDHTGETLYSLNDRTAGRTDIELLLIGPLAIPALDAGMAAAIDEAVVVDVPVDNVIVVVRAFPRDDAMRPQVEDALANGECGAPLLPPPLPPEITPVIDAPA